MKKVDAENSLGCDILMNGIIFLMVIGLVILCICALTGCALERADPAAKSARATYGAVSIVVSGDNSTATISLGDGAFTAADGDGDVKQDSTLTTRQDADMSGPVAAANPITAGINAVANVATAGINAYVQTHNKKDMSASGNSVKVPATGTSGDDCPDCEPSSEECEGGTCSPTATECVDCEPDEEHYP